MFLMLKTYERGNVLEFACATKNVFESNKCWRGEGGKQGSIDRKHKVPAAVFPNLTVGNLVWESFLYRPKFKGTRAELVLLRRLHEWHFLCPTILLGTSSINFFYTIALQKLIPTMSPCFFRECLSEEKAKDEPLAGSVFKVTNLNCRGTRANEYDG